MIIPALILGLCIIFSTGVLAQTFRQINKSNIAYRSAMQCLEELVAKLNENFPDSNLTIEETKDSIKVIGQLKYHVPSSL